MSGWGLFLTIVVVLLAIGVAVNAKDIGRYLRIRRM